MTDVLDQRPTDGSGEDRAPSARPAAPSGDRWFALGSVVLVVALLAAAAGWGLGRASADDTAGAGGAGGDHAHETGDVSGAAPAADHHAAEGGVTGTGGHVHGEGPAVPLDAATQATFARQMQITREATARFPNVAAAKAGGLIRVGTFAPGSGAHYMQKASADPNSPGRKSINAFDPANPLMWLFAGNEDTSPVVGVMFYSLGKELPPDGFAGPNDRWHQHEGLCLGDAPNGELNLPLPVDQDVTEAQCKAVNGRYMQSTGWMAHVWSAAGWESPQGVFSHDHPLLVCTDGKTAEEAQLHVGCKGLG